MHITQIITQRLPPISDVTINCHERVNLFVGSNSSGKSTILRAIKSFHTLALAELFLDLDEEEIEERDILPREHDEYASYIPGKIEVRVDEKWPLREAQLDSEDFVGFVETPEWDKVPFLYVPATRINFPVQRILERYIVDQAVEESKDKDADAVLKHLFDTEHGVFDGRYVGISINRILREMAGNRRLQSRLRDVLQMGFSCAKKICPEIVSGDAPQTYVDEFLSSDIEGTVHYGMGIRTSDHSLGDRLLYAGALSSGTQGTLLWVYALALRIADHYRLWKEHGTEWDYIVEDSWYREPAILLIDEIENHLHPTWQRRVIPALLEHFPGLQIFATTHSPFVVAGLKAGQVHLLKRDENGVVTASTNTEDIVGWTADEILRNLMGVEEPTDQLTVDRTSRLRRLREKESLTSEEESELNDLRRQVNEDLLSRGGPLDAQRERYGELMEQFIRSRQSELAQDGD